MVELRDRRTQQAYCYLDKESAVAGRLELDIRKANAIPRKEANLVK
jgi:hypothetical protein